MSRPAQVDQKMDTTNNRFGASARRCRVFFARVSTMNSLRMAAADKIALWKPCCRCGDTALGWDSIAGKPYCPSCEEAIVQGDGEPLVEMTQRRHCCACQTLGTVTIQTFPLKSSQPVEMDLCPNHLRGLLARRLGVHAYAQIRRQLTGLGLDVHDVFLLHEAFYDAQGQALLPAGDPE
jgi:hypothetical protein